MAHSFFRRGARRHLSTVSKPPLVRTSSAGLGLVVSLVACLAGCERCSTSGPLPNGAESSRLEGPSAPASATSSAPATEALPPLDDATAKVGSASVNGSAAAAPIDPPLGYHHVSTFVLTVDLAQPGQTVFLELVDRVAATADSDAAHRLLGLKVIAGKEKNEGALSFFVADTVAPDAVARRRVRLVFAGERQEVEVPSGHLQSHRCRANATSLKNPVLHAGRWGSLLFYAESSDARGLTVRLLEPPELVLDKQLYRYPDWPEPGWLWRVRVDPL